MLIQKMSLQECREFLGRMGKGRLACSRGNQPYVIPIYFAYNLPGNKAVPDAVEAPFVQKLRRPCTSARRQPGVTARRNGY